MEKRVSSLSQGQRILAAIMITDAVGFSKRMSVDEELTLKLIDRDLTLIADTCSDYGGTVLKSTGDGLLIYFVSAVEAVTCGLSIQQKLVNLSAEGASDPHLDHRIGIHLGDILVSEQDVMGNGVNITARLQTFAKPRGLCVSQTIYDVVKARLHLNATFLGPLQLKNIQEGVPAYQIALTSEAEADTGSSEPAVADEPTCTLPMSTEVLLDIAVRTLITHAYSQRIKKLVFAAYQQAWENNTKVLEQFNLRSLLVSLRDRYPNLNELDYQFQRIVMGLNRQALYRDIAAITLETLEPWYSRSIVSPEQQEPEPSKPEAGNRLDWQIQQVVEQLSQDQADALRVRKLLYCLCHQHWENDADVVGQIDLDSLVQQSLQSAPHGQDLRYHLGRIVKRVNRRKTYTRIANQIMAAFQGLYQDQEPISPSPAAATSEEATQLSGNRGGSKGGVEIEAMRLSSPPALDDDSGVSHPAETCLGVPSSQSAPGDLTTLHSSLSNPLQDRPAVSVEAAVRPQRSRETLFDLRIDIIQYANPLRAKILLYSCLHGPFGYTNQDWYSLRQQTLDDLLQQTFAYCPSFSDLDSKLAIIAHCLEPQDENAQVAATITQAMKSYYPEDPDAPIEPVAAQVAPVEVGPPPSASEADRELSAPSMLTAVGNRPSALFQT